jgi:hypothetical protein
VKKSIKKYFRLFLMQWRHPRWCNQLLRPEIFIITWSIMIMMKRQRQRNLGSCCDEVFEGRNHQTLWQWVPMVTVLGQMVSKSHLPLRSLWSYEEWTWRSINTDLTDKYDPVYYTFSSWHRVQSVIYCAMDIPSSEPVASDIPRM